MRTGRRKKERAQVKATKQLAQEESMTHKLDEEKRALDYKPFNIENS